MGPVGQDVLGFYIRGGAVDLGRRRLALQSLGLVRRRCDRSGFCDHVRMSWGRAYCPDTQLFDVTELGLRVWEGNRRRLREESDDGHL